MKKSILMFFSLLIAGSFTFLNAQTLDDVLKNHHKALNTEKWASVNTVVMKATAVQMGMELQMEMKRKMPNKFRLDADVQGQSMVQAFDGEKGWMIMPWMSTEPQDMTGAQLKQVSEQADVKGELFEYEKKGFRAELIGKETIEGKDYYNVKLVGSDESVKNYYIDTETYLLGRVKAKVSSAGQEVEIEQIFAEYMEVEGIKLPKKMETKTMMGSGIITFTEVVFNTPVDDSIFIKPAK
jgi:hypothetical protein